MGAFQGQSQRKPTKGPLFQRLFKSFRKSQTPFCVRHMCARVHVSMRTDSIRITSGTFTKSREKKRAVRSLFFSPLELQFKRQGGNCSRNGAARIRRNIGMSCRSSEERLKSSSPGSCSIFKRSPRRKCLQFCLVRISL